MGWNTVAFVLNDLSHLIEKSPRTAAHMLSHPPLSYGREEAEYAKMYGEIARNNYHEEPVQGQALKMLPTFHADTTQYFLAGHNDIYNLKFVKFHTLKGRKCVLLELPEHLQDKVNNGTNR